MRLRAAIQGNLQEMLQEEFQSANAGSFRGIRRAQELVKEELRAGVRAGFGGEAGEKMARTWTDKTRGGRPLFWGNEGLNAAAEVRSKAPTIIEAHTSGAVIVPGHGRFLAIPTPEARAMFGKGKKVTPRAFAEGRLRYVPRPRGPHLLVLDTGGVTQKGRYRKVGKRGPRLTVVMFLLVHQVRLRRRLPDWRQMAERMANRLPEIILEEYTKAAEEAA